MLKGSILSALQFSLVLYPAVYMTNKSQNKYTTLLASYTALDALLYPLDTIKTILYSETHEGLNLRRVLGAANIYNLYKGLVYKLAFNIPYLTSMYLTTQSDSGTTTLLSWLATAALYPLSTIKVRSQLMGT